MAKLKLDLNFPLKRLDLVVKGLVNTQYLGGYKSVFRGTGLEFSDYRVYNPSNDDASLIDWKASKRVNQTLVKEYVEERNLEVVFLVDVSSKMLTGTSKKLKAEFIAEFVCSLGRSILASGDEVGLILFSNKILKNFSPDSGMKQFYNLTESLSNVSNYDGFTNIDVALDFAFRNCREGSLVFLISDFIGPINYERNLKLCSKKFDLIAVTVRDLVDATLPSGVGQVVVEDPYSGSSLIVDPDKIKKEYTKEANLQLAKLKSTLKKSGGDYLYLQTDKPFVKDLIAFFKRREAEWR